MSRWGTDAYSILGRNVGTGTFYTKVLEYSQIRDIKGQKGRPHCDDIGEHER